MQCLCIAPFETLCEGSLRNIVRRPINPMWCLTDTSINGRGTVLSLGMRCLVPPNPRLQLDAARLAARALPAERIANDRSRSAGSAGSVDIPDDINGVVNALPRAEAGPGAG